MTRLLILLPINAEAPAQWVLLGDDGRIAARGGDLADRPADAGDTIAVVPGEAVVVHWAELPRLAPAQAAVAARMMAADVVAAPLDSVHVAIGPEADGWRALAIVDRALMAGWLARLAGAGIDPERILPAPLLIAPPEAGVATLRDGGLVLVRGARQAFAAEPELAALLIGDTPATEIDAAAFEAGLAAALDAAPVDLRQGDYALKRPWQWDRRRLRRLALLAAAILVVTLVGDIARWLRHDFAADAAASAARATAQEVLPRGAVVSDPEAQVAGRLAETGGGAWQALAAQLVTAVQAGDGVELTALRYADGALQATAAAPSAAALAALADRLRAAGLTVSAGAPRAEGGRQLADLTVTAA